LRSHGRWAERPGEMEEGIGIRHAGQRLSGRSALLAGFEAVSRMVEGEACVSDIVAVGDAWRCVEFPRQRFLPLTASDPCRKKFGGFVLGVDTPLWRQCEDEEASEAVVVAVVVVEEDLVQEMGRDIILQRLELRNQCHTMSRLSRYMLKYLHR
jgi:hypothetical protein